MTLEQQVHQLQTSVDELKRQMAMVAKLLEALQKDSHPPIDFLERIAQAINGQEMFLRGKIREKVAENTFKDTPFTVTEATLGD